jgi:hypothetical protein
MSYAQGEADIATQIKTLAAWDDTNCVSTANDSTAASLSLHNSGVSDKYCILRPGAFTSVYHGSDNSFAVHTWLTVIEIAVFFVDASGNIRAPEKALVELRGDIMNTLNARMKAGGSTVSLGKLIAGSEIQQDSVATLGEFIFQELIYQWDEESDYTQSD